MQSKWADDAARDFVARYGDQWGEDLALRTYTSQLLGQDPALVLHGGGNTSVKSTSTNVLGKETAIIHVKASGFDLASISPEGHSALLLEPLLELRSVSSLNDEEMTREVRGRLVDYRSANPSIEALVHAFIPAKYIDHTHADAVLTLTNQVGGWEKVAEALGSDVVIIDYIKPGFDLARVMAEAFEANPGKRAAVWMQHGIMTWGETARESYETMIEMVNRAEQYTARTTRKLQPFQTTGLEEAQQRWTDLAPVLRGLLAARTGDTDHPFRQIITAPLINREILDFLDCHEAGDLVKTPPLTSDHLIRTKAFPLWIDRFNWTDPAESRDQLEKAVNAFRRDYEAYIDRHSSSSPSKGRERLDTNPRVILIRGVGAICTGTNIDEASTCRDITAQTIAAKAKIAGMGTYRGMEDDQLFAMEFRGLQQAKLSSGRRALEGKVAVVTGAAGAIGSGICRRLLAEGCHVAVTDLAGAPLNSLAEELTAVHGRRVAGIPVDVADPKSVTAGFEQVSALWGGVDLVIINAGIAHVSSLAEMKLETFQKLERVNVEGTLNLLSESGRHFERQGSGGDIILISTKNVFAPGAKFGAYSATKAGSHQLARIASLELAGIGVRVNMVAPDAVFSEGSRKSGLWAEVGPDRMKARGLSEDQLHEYYRSRNLLKSPVTAEHVANAVMYFATRQSPTTGATIPVDGGLPDATPR